MHQRGGADPHFALGEAIVGHRQRQQRRTFFRLEHRPAASVSVPLVVVEPSAEAARFEVVDDHEPALLHVRAKRRCFAVGHRPPVDFDDVGDRVVKELRIVERERVDLVVRVEEADLIQDLHEVAFRQRIAVAPRRPAAVPIAAGRRRVFQADEGEASVVGDVRVLAKRSAREAELCDGRRSRQQQERRGGQAANHATEYRICKSEV